MAWWRAEFAALLSDVPVDLGRDEARDLAREELSKPSYDRDVPILTRILRWFLEQLERLLDAATGVMSTPAGIVAAVAVVVALAAVIVLRAGPMARRAAAGRADAVLPARRRSAAEHRAAADAAAAHGDWNTAVVERFRAVAATLEERGVLDVRSARTAGEVAAEAGAVLPGVAGQLRAGATQFAAVRYGYRHAGRADDEAMRELDAAASSARPGQAKDAPELVAPR